MDIKNVKLVIFDMDGLMLDTEQCYYYGVKEMCEKKENKSRYECIPRRNWNFWGN